MLQLDSLDLRYEPFPIGIAKPVLAPDVYRQMLGAWPPLDKFHFLAKVGNKYSLSEKYRPDEYHAWVAKHPAWSAFHAHVKKPDFSYGVVELLRSRHIDLGFAFKSGQQKLKKRLKGLLRGRLAAARPELSARFEFSMLPADGGSVTPHTDNPSKVITLVVSMADESEWDPAFGGGTEVNRHKDPTRSFNRQNGKAEFAEMELLDVYPFEPNQCVLFVKTFNSWHCVRPMTGNGSKAMRRTLTINIETGD